MTAIAVQGMTLSHFVDFSNSTNLDPNFDTRLFNNVLVSRLGSMEFWGLTPSHYYTYTGDHTVFKAVLRLKSIGK